MNESLIKPYWALRIGLGASAFLAGLDKFFNILAQSQSRGLSRLIDSLDEKKDAGPREDELHAREEPEGESEQ